MTDLRGDRRGARRRRRRPRPTRSRSPTGSSPRRPTAARLRARPRAAAGAARRAPAGARRGAGARGGGERRRTTRPQASWRMRRRRPRPPKRSASSLDEQLTSTQELLAELHERRRTGGRPPAAQLAQLRAAISARFDTQQQQARLRATAAARRGRRRRRAGATAAAELTAAQSAVSALTASIAAGAGRARRREPATRTRSRRCPATLERRDRRRQRSRGRRLAAVGRRWSRTRTRRSRRRGDGPRSRCVRTSRGGDSPDDHAALVAADVPLLAAAGPPRDALRRRDGRTDLLVRVYPGHGSRRHARAGADRGGVAPRTPVPRRGARGGGKRRRHARGVAARLPTTSARQRAAWIAHAAALADPPRRAESWTRAAETNVLPDRWIALGYRDGVRRFAALGGPIADRLKVGPDPQELADTDPAAPLGEGARWLVDFERAVQAGMALRIPLAGDDTAGLDRLVVLGVRPTSDAAEGARRIARAARRAPLHGRRRAGRPGNADEQHVDGAFRVGRR